MPVESAAGMLTWNRPVVEPLANRARYRQQGTIAVTGHGRRRSQVKKGFPSLRACRHAPEDRIPKPEWVEKIAPGRIRAGDPENGFAEEPVVGRRSSGVPGLAGKEASNPLPLRVLHHFATQGRPPFFQPRLTFRSNRESPSNNSMSISPSAARVQAVAPFLPRAKRRRLAPDRPPKPPRLNDWRHQREPLIPRIASRARGKIPSAVLHHPPGPLGSPQRREANLGQAHQRAGSRMGLTGPLWRRSLAPGAAPGAAKKAWRQARAEIPWREWFQARVFAADRHRRGEADSMFLGPEGRAA